MGSGTALILWHAGRVKVVGVDPGLSSWLSGRFVRHFPEAEWLDWSQVEVRTEDVEIELDIETGLVAHTGDIEVRIAEPIAQHDVSVDDLVLDGSPHHLSQRLAPCRQAMVTVGGQLLAGEPRVDESGERPRSTAFLSIDQVWSR